MVKRRWILMVVALSALVFLAACATADFKRDGYRTLVAAAATYDATMQSLSDLYDKGIISDEEKGKAIRYGGYFWGAYQTAAEAMVVYCESGSATDQERATKAMALLSGALARFMELAQPLLQKGE